MIEKAATKSKIGETKRASEIGFKGSHNYTWMACVICGKERWVSISNIRKGIQQHCKSCQASIHWENGRLRYQDMRRENNPNWKGGKHIRPRGYVDIRLSPDDFFRSMTDKYGYVLEHRLVMAKYMKRCLLPWEIVHHKNGIKGDNHLDNLMLIGVRGKHNTAINKRVKELERIVAKQNIEIKMLQFRLRELENVEQTV